MGNAFLKRKVNRFEVLSCGENFKEAILGNSVMDYRNHETGLYVFQTKERLIKQYNERVR